MRKLIVSLLIAIAMTVTFTVTAVDSLVKYVPSGADGVVSINIAAILTLPVVAEMRRDNKDVKEQWDEFQAHLKSFGLKMSDMPTEALIFFRQDKSISGMLMKTRMTEDKFGKMLNSEQKKQKASFYSVEQIAGHKAFVLTPPQSVMNPEFNNFTGGCQKVAISYIHRNVAILADKSMMSAILSGIKNNAKTTEELQEGTKLLDRKALAWMFFKNSTPAANQQQEQQPMMNPMRNIETIGLSLNLTGANKKGLKLDAEVSCRDQNSASMMAMQANGLIMMGLPALFGRNQQLGNQLAQSISIKPSGNKLKASIEISEELGQKISSYMEENKKEMAQKQQIQ